MLFVESLEENKLVLLIDGIDEINTTYLRHNIVDKINSFIAQYPQNKIIVSSRITGYQETSLNMNFKHFLVEDFNRKQIARFVNNWYSAIYETETSEELELASDLLKSINSNQSVYLLAKNPLLITIIALMHYQGCSLPDKRVSLYESSIDTFLENWVKQRTGILVDKNLLIEILTPIAFFIHANYTDGLIKEKELKSRIRNNIKNIYPTISKKEEYDEIASIISFLREDAGFLFEKGFDESGEALFGFVHQTFLEYFQQLSLKQGGKKKDMMSLKNIY